MNCLKFLLVASVFLSNMFAHGEDSLISRFAKPPENSKVQCWWHWCSDNVSEKGLAADLKAMSEMDVGTAHVFSPEMMRHIPGYHAQLLTPEWKRLFAFAVAEAKKYGIKLGFHNGPGWSSSGGPWIKPEDSMKVVVSAFADVPAGAERVKLSTPPVPHDFYRDIAVYAFPIADEPERLRIDGDFPGDFAAFAKSGAPVTIPLSKGMDYEASVTLEYSAPFAPGTLIIQMPQSRVVMNGLVEASIDGASWREIGKLAFDFYADVGDAKYLAVTCGDPAKFFRVKFRSGNVPEWMGGKPFDVKLSQLAFTTLPMVSDVGRYNSSTASFGYKAAFDPQCKGVDPKDLVRVSVKPAADGTLALGEVWNGRQAKGHWRILRVGYKSTGKNCAPATIPGLECDKLSKQGLDAHWPHMPQVLLDTPGAKGTVAVSIIDSYEAGGQNWTEELPQEFKRRRGYELLPYLPAVTGYTVGTTGETQKFLFDFQQTIAELIAENYFDYFAERCHREGLAVALESYGGAFDEIRCFRSADIPTGEFWLGAIPHGSPRLAASAGHLNGRSQIAAEAFTTEAMPGRWQLTPYELKVSGDRGWLEGISQIVFHSYVSQPFANVRPGLSLGRHGSQFNRNTTWWKEGRGWSEYVRRGQFLLQSGKPVADLLILRGVGGRDRTGRPDALEKKGYTFDFCGKDDLLRLETEDGKVFVPGGEPYQFISLGWDKYLTIEVLEKVKTLLEQGVHICGPRPAESPSLADDPATWRKLADEIWSGKYPNLSPSGDLGLAEAHFKTTPSVNSKGRLGCLRRRIEGRDFFFVMNDSDKDFDDTVVFAASGYATLWDAKDGTVTRLESVSTTDGRRSVRLSLPPRGSAFIGFVTESEWNACPAPKSEAKSVVADLSRDWTIVSFDGPAAPKVPRKLESLVDWSKSDDPALKYFSGRAVYEKQVEGWRLKDGERLVLDLGEVHDIANVWVNDEFLGCLWEPPYRIDIPSSKLSAPSSKLRIEVINTWPNRMIGDAIARKEGAAEPTREGFPVWVLEDRPDSGTGIYTWSNFDYGWKASDKPLPAGLLGPVKILKQSSSAMPIDAAKLIAHRGESFDAPENTLPAYQMAVDRGFGFECDIYRSKDGRLFTFHDNTLTRTTAGANTNRCIDASWEDEISKVNVGGWGKWKGSKFDPTRPALFSEVLDLARDGRWIYVEVKGNDPTWVPTIKEELAKAKKANSKNVLFISFGDKVCAELKRQLPEYRVYWLVNSRKWWQKDNAPYPASEIIAKLRSMGVDGVDIEFRPEVVTAEYVEEIRKAGFQVHVWTIDDPDVAHRAFAVGADTLTTNRAKYIHDYEPVFWNERAVQFVYPPAFDFPWIPNASRYLFTAKDAQGGVHVFTNHSPKASLSPIWKKIPENCHVTLTVESLGAKREIVGTRSFWRMPEFHEGTYPKAKRGYAEASLMAYDYIFNLPSTRYFMEHGKPDPSYALNAYPSKMHNWLIRAMVRYAKVRPDRRAEAIKLARIAADYLISVSQPADAPLAYFPPTYDKPKAGEPGIGGVGMHGQGKNMLLYPADVGLAYLALYRETNEHKYLQAAERIGNTYLKLQGPDGTCPLKVDEKSGKPVNTNRAFPIGICRFLQELSGFIDDARYGEAVRRGIEFVRKGPMRNWNWEGQFEDVEPSAPYKNLTKHSACDTAIFLLEQDVVSEADRAFARKVAEFTEDQFICWQTPCDDAGKGPLDYGADWSMKYRTWHCPAVLEQYECYLPIDASARKAIILYLALWKDTHEAQYLAKARALADAMVNMQSENGRIPTFWTDGNIANPKTDWLNCMSSSAAALAQCADAN